MVNLFPLQVIFKCCKLIPVLIGGIIIQVWNNVLLLMIVLCCRASGTGCWTLSPRASCVSAWCCSPWPTARYSRPQHVTELHCTALQLSPSFNLTGVLMICLALVADAVIGNVQEKTIRQFGATNSEVKRF